jgi:hypothetical protein
MLFHGKVLGSIDVGLSPVGPDLGNSTREVLILSCPDRAGISAWPPRTRD